MSIEELDICTLAKIFSHLDTIEEKLKMESVCKKWQLACRESIAWKNIKKLDFINGNYTLPGFSNRATVQDFFNGLFNKVGTHLTSLSFFIDKWTILYLSRIQHRCPNLKHLELVFADVSEFMNKSYLKFLGLSCIHELLVNRLFTGLKKLKSLYVDNYLFTNGTAVLESLNDGIEVISFSAASFTDLANPSDDLKIGRWHSLKELTLCFWKIPDSLWNIFTSRNSMTYLSLRACEISQSQILNVTQLKNLDVLFLCNIGGMHDHLLDKITKDLKNLKQLNLSWCHELSTDALKKIGELKKLNFLSLMRLDNVDDSVIIKIVNHCKRLMGLNLSACKNISKTALYKLEKLKHLTLLYADYMDQIDNKTFDHIKNLTTLECEGCKNVGDVGIKKIIRSSPHLGMLNVARTGITVASLKNICDARGNTRETLSIKADPSLIFEYINERGDPPAGIVFLDAGVHDSNNEHCPNCICKCRRR